MKINFEKLKEVELKYSNSPVSVNTLQKMVDLVTDNFVGSNGFIETKNQAYFLSVQTLIDLEILEVDSEDKENIKKDIQQLNS